MGTIILIFTHIFVWFAGIVTGMYFASQIELDIEQRITTKETYPDFVKKHYKKWKKK
tara:strand:- start:1448 stop:1618 length:171 start_codon:yes stop_codon:yes gene_type:complete